jgi:hypothetical protein
MFVLPPKKRSRSAGRICSIDNNERHRAQMRNGDLMRGFDEEKSPDTSKTPL